MQTTSRVDWLDTQGGHICLSFAVFLIGVALYFWKPDMGKTVIEFSLAALGISMRNAKQGEK